MKILFIGSRLFDDVSWYAKKHNITTIITESNENAENIDLADKKYIVPRGMDKPMEIAIKEDVDAIIPLIGIDPPLPEIGKMKDNMMEDYNIPVISSGAYAANLASNKFETKELLDEKDINTPKYNHITKPYSVDELSEKLPIVLKTPDGQAGRGVQVAINKEEINDFIESRDDIFMEQFIQGSDISVEVLRWNNETVALTSVYKGDTTLEGTHPMSKIKRSPFNIKGIDNKDHENKLLNLAEQLANLVNMEGTMDIDILYSYSTKEDYVIELNTRPSGTRYMTAATTNIYPLCQLIDMARGQWSAKSVRKNKMNFVATELPIKDFPTDKRIPKIKLFDGPNSYIVHGPEHYQRVTVRSESYSKLNDMVYDLVPDYSKLNGINFN